MMIRTVLTVLLLAPVGSPKRAGDLFASSLTGIGDLDGDGHADLLVGDSTGGPAGTLKPLVWALSPARGEVLFRVESRTEHLIGRPSLVGPSGSGSDEPTDFVALLRVGYGDLAEIRVASFSGLDGSRSSTRALVESKPTRLWSLAIGSAGDFDGDGRSDLLVAGNGGAYPSDGERWSAVWVLSARGLDLLLHLEPAEGEPALLRTATVLPRRDGQAHPDLIVAAGDPVSGRGNLRRVSGGDGRACSEWLESDRSWFRPDLFPIEDRNGDGFPELLVLDLVPSQTRRRRVRLSVLSGRTGAVLTERTLERWALMGPHLTRLGDLTGDGRREILLCDHDSLSAGHALVLAGDDLRELHEISHAWPSDSGLDHFGIESAALGDVDGDGVCDFAVGGNSPWSQSFSHGFVDVHSGRTAKRLHRFLRADVLGK